MIEEESLPLTELIPLDDIDADIAVPSHAGAARRNLSRRGWQRTVTAPLRRYHLQQSSLLTITAGLSGRHLVRPILQLPARIPSARSRPTRCPRTKTLPPRASH